MINRKPDPERPGSWRKYREGLCKDCTAGCCTTLVEVTYEDLVRLELIPENSLDFHSLDEIYRQLKEKQILQDFHRKTQKFVLAQKAGKDCLYLNDQRKCTVYEKRPQTCRDFPKISSRSGYCPYDPVK